jgi:peptidoglycan hydrolase-like protein with peptidoglycan-binding domain
VTKTPKGVILLAAAALCGSVVTIAVRGTPAPAAPTPPPVGTASVVRTDLSTSVLTEGTLGYAPSPPVVDRLAGTYTGLLAAGTVVEPGQVLFRVDDEPVVLMSGAVPAWRMFAPGMTDGPDVQELEANLIALGDGSGLLATAAPHFGPAAEAAVRRWQASLGVPATGSIDFGAVVFAASALRVAALGVSLGQPASPGDMPYQVTTTARTVAVPLTPNDPTVAVGQSVSIVLPSNATTGGRVTAVGAPPPSSSSGSSSPASSAVLTVVPDDPAVTGTEEGEEVQVSLTVQNVRHVLAVPIASLLALAGGGYGLEVVDHTGHHHLVGVRTGVFAGGSVQVSGAGLVPGTRVVVAQ